MSTATDAKTNVPMHSCAWCLVCCRGIDMFLTDAEVVSGRFPWGKRALLASKCGFLGDIGCQLTPADRPFVCRAFPFVFYRGRVGVFQYCPEAMSLVHRLASDEDLRHHLDSVRSEYRALVEAGDEIVRLMDSEIEEWGLPCFVALDEVGRESEPE